MSGLSLASHPLLAGAGRHRFGANHVVCALALCALVLRARPCGGFACFASCRSPLPGHAGPPSLTHLACPRALAWALFVFAWGRALLGLVVGVFACGWLGFVFTRGACSPFGVCAFLVLACLLGVAGAVWLRPPALPRLACLRAHALVWACWRVRWFCVRGGRRVALLGRDNRVPPHTAWRCPRCVACKRRVGALSWCANTRAHGERKRGGRGGASWGGPWLPGWGLWVVLAYHVGEQCPPEGEQKFGTTGAGAGCAPGRGGSFGSGGEWGLRSFCWGGGAGGGWGEGAWVRLGGGGFGWGFWWWLVG